LALLDLIEDAFHRGFEICVHSINRMASLEERKPS